MKIVNVGENHARNGVITKRELRKQVWRTNLLLNSSHIAQIPFFLLSFTPINTFSWFPIDYNT
ncbi:hypothetical protein HanXRQr2_Chr16g0754151 [Helianthus annuus]|uniref:Uncharacterized protein n=1 Tax=Helianthus annuus TaxID=4232 RepID=A0A251RZW9_HELAN|nr:hypothetical protein HanXRQr2_Chr16g0754151 [Helianthus annuus]KAJ0821662.1 hypothetical protein HanPSC8_Chr16g0722861 [Helianthus annuus]